MIPLVGGAAVLPRVVPSSLKQNNIAVTIVHPPNQLKSITSSTTINSSFSPGFRILQSRTQRRRSSLSSLCSLTKFEDEELRKLNSRGSSIGIVDNELRNCLETKQLISKERIDNDDITFEDSPCASSDSKDNEEHSCNSMISNNVAIDNNSPDVENTQPKKKKCKSRSKSSCKMRNKKSSKSKKSAKMKNRTLSKAPSVFERLTNVTKSNSNQGNSSNTPRKPSTTIIFNKSCGNLLEIKRLQATYMPVLKQNKPKISLCLPKVSMSKTSNGIKAQTPKQQSCQSVQTSKSSHSLVMSPRKSLETTAQDNLKNENVGTRKVYLSEVQSKMFDGIPGAPPATPFPEELATVEYIPCLMDIKSQRAVKTKLEKIVTRLKSEDQQRKENAIKQSQKKQKELLTKLKQQQRAEIYALNKVMTELENQNFKKFMMKQEAVSSMGV